MRKVDILLERNTYEPGNTIQGEVVIETDEDFEHKRVTLQFVGIEEARVIRGVGDSRRVYKELIELINDEYILQEGGFIHKEKTYLPFELKIPRQLPGSYYGEHGSIRYSLKATVEISWALDPKHEKDIVIVRPLEHRRPKASTQLIDWNGLDQILIEVPRHIVSPPEPFPVRVMVRGDPSLTGIRFELLFKEFVAPKKRIETTTHQLCTFFMKKENISYNNWMDIRMRTDESWPRPFTSRIIRTQVVLKVTAAIHFRFDRSVEFPLDMALLHTDLFEQDEFNVEI